MTEGIITIHGPNTLKTRINAAWDVLPEEKKNQKALAAYCEVKPPSVSDWFSGKTKTLKGKSLIRAAQYLNVNDAWLESGKGTPRRDDAASNLIAGPTIRGRLPLISWVRAGELCESPDNFQPGDAEDWFDCPVVHGPNAYCLRIVGDSMDDGTADGYRDGEVTFVDPAVDAVPGRDVVVRTPDNKMTFKRLKQDTEGWYLLGLNGKKIIRVPDDTVFCGVVIFSGVRRG